jgi:serine protease Do
VITNAHVAHGPRATVKLADERDFDAIVIARDRQCDLAALKIEAADLPGVAIASSGVLRVGELVLAVGNPLGLVGVLTTGIVHAVSPSDANGQWIQADVQLAPGNSGGPLANSQGHVIGINCMIAGGLALAVPSYTVEKFLRRVERPYLGVTTQPVLMPLGDKRAVGLLVVEVTPGSPAEADLLIGDVLIAANGQPFNAPGDLVSTLHDTVSSQMLQLDLVRGGKRRSYNVAVHSRAAEREAV